MAKIILKSSSYSIVAGPVDQTAFREFEVRQMRRIFRTAAATLMPRTADRCEYEVLLWVFNDICISPSFMISELYVPQSLYAFCGKMKNNQSLEPQKRLYYKFSNYSFTQLTTPLSCVEKRVVNCRERRKEKQSSSSWAAHFYKCFCRGEWKGISRIRRNFYAALLFLWMTPEKVSGFRRPGQRLFSPKQQNSYASWQSRKWVKRHSVELSATFMMRCKSRCVCFQDFAGDALWSSWQRSLYESVDTNVLEFDAPNICDSPTYRRLVLSADFSSRSESELKPQLLIMPCESSTHLYTNGSAFKVMQVSGIKLISAFVYYIARSTRITS